ncbi:hypothetical protein V8E52_004027 [Russula decolorans]
MSSTAQETSSTSSTSNTQLITNALADYTKITGVDLSKNTFAAAIEQWNSPEAILELLQERENSFKEYRDNNRRLINCLTPAVRVIQTFSGILGEALTLVPFPPAKALFVGIDVLLAAASGVTSSYDALLELFECLGNFLKRLEIYTTIPRTPIMTEVIVKIMVELLSVLALASKQIKEGRFKKFTKKILRESEVETVLRRLDRLTQEEVRMTVAQSLGVVHGLVGSVKVLMEDGDASTDSIRRDLVTLHQTLNKINKTQREQLQKEVQHWLTPPDPSTNQNFVSEVRHSGTAAWFFESEALTEWKASGSLLWIHGKPGAGKSTLLSAIIQEVERMQAAGLATMAYYYFDFRDVKKQDCDGLLSSLILQLSAESDSCYNILSQLYSVNSRGIRKPSVSALKKCLKDMLSLPGQGPIYIVVDALDECPNFPGRPSAREKVLDLIEELVDLNRLNVHLCVASRPEMDIRLVLEELTTLKISLHDEIGQKEDIIRYIESVVYSDRSMRRWKEEDKRLVVDTLSDKSDGM